MTMEDELSISLDGKNLANLRVVDLKQELEKRGLSKSGSKKDLIKRLKQQLEFEKLCEERKSTGDCELKKELDARTEQNEFVQRYLAQQQKIFAEQKEVKRLVELEESQKKSDSEECILSPKIDQRLSSADDDTEREVDSSSESSTGVSTSKFSEIEISLKNKDVEKEITKESEEKQSSESVIVERHVIKIERDKVFKIVSNKNQDDYAGVKTEDIKNSSKDITREVSSEKECSVTDSKNKKDILPVIKSKQIKEKEESKDISAIEGTQDVSPDNKNQRDVSIRKDSIVCEIDKSFPESRKTNKVVISNVKPEDKNSSSKTDTGKHISVIKNKNKSDLVIENTEKHFSIIGDTGKTDLKIEDATKSALKFEDTDKSALTIKNTDKSALLIDKSAIEDINKNVNNKSTVESDLKGKFVDKVAIDDIVSLKIENSPLIDECADKSTLKTENNKSDSLKLESIDNSALEKKNSDQIPLKKKDTDKIILKNKDTDQSALRNKHVGDCFVINEDLSKSTLKSEGTHEKVLKGKSSDKHTLKSENTDISAKKREGTDESPFLKNEGKNQNVFLNIHETDLGTCVKTENESYGHRIALDCQSNSEVVGQNKKELSSTSEKKVEIVVHNISETQCNPDKKSVHEKVAKIETDSSQASKIREASNLVDTCQTSSHNEQNVNLLPSFSQKVEPVCDSNIELVHTSAESSETNVADISLENKSVSMDSAVPYSLSDIQLPDSPSNIVVKPAIKANDSDKDSHSDNDMHKNGVNSGSKPYSKLRPIVDTSNKKKELFKESTKLSHPTLASTKNSKVSETESASVEKSKHSKIEVIAISEKKPSKKTEEKSYPNTAKHSKQYSNSDEDKSSDSNDSRKKKLSRSKISMKHSKTQKDRSRSSSSSQERIPEKMSKNIQKDSSESRTSRIVKKGKIDSSNKKASKSKDRSYSSSSQSSQSRDSSPVAVSKQDTKKSAKLDLSRTKKKGDYCEKASKSRSRSPHSKQVSQIREQRHDKSKKDDSKKSIELDSSRNEKNLHDKSTADQKGSSQSLIGSCEKSPEKQSKEDCKKNVEMDALKGVKKHHKASSDRKYSKSRSRSPIEKREKRLVKGSKDDINKLDMPQAFSDFKKSHISSSQKYSKGRSPSPTSVRSSRSQDKSPVKHSKSDIKKSLAADASKIAEKQLAEQSSDKNASKSRSRSPSNSQDFGIMRKKSATPHTDSSDQKSRSRSPSVSRSREKSPTKLSDEEKKSKTADASKVVKQLSSGSFSDQKASKSRSSSPSSSQSSQSREGSPMKSSEDSKKLIVTDASKTNKELCTRGSSHDTSKSRSRSPFDNRNSKSKEKSPINQSKDVKKPVLTIASRSGRKRQSESSYRSSSGSPPPHQTLELFFSQSTKKKDTKKSMKTPENLQTSKTSAAVEQISNLSHDPPRKKLKINRNNVVIPSESSERVSVEEVKKFPSSEKTETGTRESANSMQCETVEREMGEIIENSPEVKYEPRKINFPGRKLSRKSSEDQSSIEPKSKKSKWGKFASSQKASQAINISTDSLKNWFPEFKLVSEPSIVNDSIPEESPPIKEEKKFFPLKPEEEIVDQHLSSTSHQINEESNLETTTKLSGPVSKILFIQNLVRPFTVLQLRELLKQKGNFIEEDFWIDKIKSKCFVTYETEEEAIKTRNALNGVRWPHSNPKILVVEFSTEEEFEYHRTGKDTQKPVVEPVPEVHESLEEKMPQPPSDHRRKDRDSDRKKDRERYRPQVPVREWDKDKVIQDSPEKEKADKNNEAYRGSDRKDKKDSKKRINEDTPAKLLDDLFQKTKATPCIYWLPLTEAQVLEQEESRRVRKLEREKRNQQREKEESEYRNKRSRIDHKNKESENRRSSTRSRSPTSRRR